MTFPATTSTFNLKLQSPNSSLRDNTVNVDALIMNRNNSRESISEAIISERQKIHRDRSPVHRSPISDHERKQRQRQAEEDRKSKRLSQSLKIRGGLDKMEEFVIRGERLKELQELAKQAEEHTLPSEFAEKYEEANGEDIDDDDLLECLEARENKAAELEILLAELFIS
ncbi:hypothetical protein TBLA_0I00390 [Henningerozyma blattae CBS 6284]|uniref:Uncharacterized protein n=1 Tax=Henningerozyma blattae (strain ATCC 34711 / CBS 6284 / DSM 70876 / NBRC 10599 / NRRL Y-10934 / UCD 77-7) TaxID=1071380 RepID=I2H8K0_HENB6|nr:hypothetical protein TBLA_0I00390 [Tetrapisispora blattae CBS 6284]CCH62702.1 hypothetical protein TBLA_0I00390 [Tetrapisispora blattae CBS 6284]